MFKLRSFIHKTRTQSKIISLALYCQCYSDSLFWLWGRQRQWVTHGTQSVARGKKSKMWLTRQGLGSWGCLKAPFNTNCIFAGQVTYFCQNASWENTLTLKDSLKLLQPNPFRGQDSHKATPRNPFKLLKWLKWSCFWLKDTKHSCRWVGPQNHRISYTGRDPQGSLKSNFWPCTGLLVKFQLRFLT